MGPVNWIAVALAAAFGTIVAMAWNATLLRAGARPLIPDTSRKAGHHGVLALAMVLASVMMGHNFARVGAETLAFKPWLYFMMSGGLALFFTMPAVWLTHVRARAEPMTLILDCLSWLVAYLAMGAVFWALG